MKKLLLLIALITLPSSAQAYENDLDGLLKDHLKTVTKSNITYNGVNYTDWGKDPRHQKVRDAILATNPQTLGSKNEKLAYWINAYNVLTIDLITREGETESIKNLGGTFTSPWKKHKWTIAGKEYALDDIEHGIIRPLGDPRIHFAVNCAAKSCPDLRNEAYRADRLNTQLDEQTRLTFKNATKGYKKDDGNAVRVTKVMDWFDEDFNDGDLNSWLQTYFSDIDDNTDINFFKYDWSLNKQ
ncbi:MAG: DUF547 domain-containing protein [Bdellovibrionales bacterium]